MLPGVKRAREEISIRYGTMMVRHRGGGGVSSKV